MRSYQRALRTADTKNDTRRERRYAEDAEKGAVTVISVIAPFSASSAYLRSLRVSFFVSAVLNAILGTALVTDAGIANAQVPSRATSRIALEGRIDGIIASNSAIHAGLGVTAHTGTYLRSGFVGGIGRSEDGISGRIDFINRFHLDPFRESRWAPYAGGGLSARFEDNRTHRFYLIVFAGLDGPVSRGLATSLEAGFGGGGRIGVIVRQAAAERR